MKLSVIGISHREAPVDVRERYCLPGDLSRRLLRELAAEGIIGEAVVVDTCNRTDVYLAFDREIDEREYLLGHIRRMKNIPPSDDMSCFYHKTGLDAVNYLFRVSSSLESQIVGEYQILGQIKDAYRLAVREGSTGFFLNRLMHFVFRVGKRVRTETQLGCDSVSLAQAAVDLAHQIFSSLDGRTVLFIGAGQTAELAARAVIRGGVRRIIVANRTLERAESVAAELLSEMNSSRTKEGGEEGGGGPLLDVRNDGGDIPPAVSARAGEDGLPNRSPDADAPLGGIEVKAITLEEMPAALAEADLVISSTGAPEPVLTAQGVGTDLAHRTRPLFIIDIAVPRDVDESLGAFPNVYLHNIDDLNSIVENNIQRRRLEIPRAEAIVADELERFGKWLRSRQLTPTVKLLIRRFDELRHKELERYGKNLSWDQAKIALFAESLCRKILHSPLACLREIAENGTAGESMAATDIIRRMFDLDCEEGNS